MIHQDKDNHGLQGPTEDLRLHEAVFHNDSNKIYELLSDKLAVQGIINAIDKHGNTPLHLACMLGRSKDIVTALLESGAAIDVKNLNRWYPFHEATSYGDREVITLLHSRFRSEVYEKINKGSLTDYLTRTKNFRTVLNWEFGSWVPLVSRVLPNDVCVITKFGRNIRIDTRLINLGSLWAKNEWSLICSHNHNNKWFVLNHTTKKYQHLNGKHRRGNGCLEKEVNDIMASDIMDLEFKSGDLQFQRSTSGWIWKADRNATIGKYNSAIYNIDNVFLVTRKRREHLDELDLKRNKQAFRGFKYMLKMGSPQDNDTETTENNNEDADGEDVPQKDSLRQSLTPPPPSNVTWDEYLNSEPGKHPCLGREIICKTTKTSIKASVAITEEFPITKHDLLNLLCVVPLKHFDRTKEFVELRLPDGFPVRLEVPIFSFLSARITFQEFEFIDDNIDPDLFDIPDDYKMDSNLMPMFSKTNEE